VKDKAEDINSDGDEEDRPAILQSSDIQVEQFDEIKPKRGPVNLQIKTKFSQHESNSMAFQGLAPGHNPNSDLV
jgi:hypothetical protein